MSSSSRLQYSSELKLITPKAKTYFTNGLTSATKNKKEYGLQFKKQKFPKVT